MSVSAPPHAAPSGSASPLGKQPAREYVYPIVRPAARRTAPTAHPSPEAWVAPTARRSPDGAASAPPRVRGKRSLVSAPGRGAPEDRYAVLQRRLLDVDDATGRRLPGRAIVVLPSRAIDRPSESAAAAQALEERMLCSLLMLGDPGLRITYVTSLPITPAIVGYYLSLIPARRRASARRRLTLLSACDASRRPLSEKLLAQPLLMARIRRSIGRRDLAFLLPYETTTRERDVALGLDLPMYGAPPHLWPMGTKSGCRELFARAGVAHPLGAEHVSDLPGAARAIADLRRLRPNLTQVMIKLNEGVAGRGNATVEIGNLPRPGAGDELERITQRVRDMVLESAEVGLDGYLAALAARGGIVEERITGRALFSPSVQMQITAGGEVEILSTHDQLLGGRGGQSYIGCCFPALPAYAQTITAMAERVGRVMAQAGAIGRSAIDFVVAQDGDDWRAYAIELNLRRGGTTHPFVTLELLTGGRYDAARCEFITRNGQTKHYMATDHLEARELRRLRCDGLLELIPTCGLGFDRARQAGTVFHMLSSLDGLGEVGLTAVGDSREEARETFQRARSAVLQAAGRIPAGHGSFRLNELRPGTLPSAA